MSETQTPALAEKLVQAVLDRLFGDPALSTFAILDGANIPELLPKLAEESPEHICLYRGELEPDLAECAPYLVRLERDSPFTRWLVSEGWGNNWGIFASTATDLQTLRRHFRGFLLVMSPEGKRLYFRYYDPRVLRSFLPTCTPAELKQLFGPVGAYLLPDKQPQTLLRFSRQPTTGELALESVKLKDREFP